MEGPRLDGPDPEAVEAIGQLGGRLAGMGDSQHLGWFQLPRADEVSEAVGDGPGLAGSRAGDDAQRTGDDRRGRPLLGVEVGEQVVARDRKGGQVSLGVGICSMP